MLWNLIVEAKVGDELSGSITVEANNWYNALRAGLEKHNIDGAVLSTLSCRIQEDNSVVASDVVSKRVFRIRRVETTAEPDVFEEKNSEKGELGDDAGELALVPHEVFFEKDSHSDDGSGVTYRERAIAVAPDISQAAAAHLAHHYFEVLKERDGDDGSKLFISIHIFDHKFKDHSERPAVVALTWREWQGRKPKVLYPLSGDEGITFSMLPPPPEPLFLISKEDEKPRTDATETADEYDAQTDLSMLQGIGEQMIAAFERMQDIYGIHDHDEAAAFTLSLAMDLIKCDGGSCMLFSPLEYKLYVSCAEGEKAAPHQCKSVSSTTGIIGFALRNSAVINVSDPLGDGRFDDIFDGRESFFPRNVLCAPMQFEGHVIGVLELIDSSKEDGFSDADANLISYLGTSFAEYAAVSLPSRHPDFSDRDFLSDEKDSNAPPPADSSDKKVEPRIVEAPSQKSGETATPGIDSPTTNLVPKSPNAKKAKSGKKQKKR